MPKRDYSTEYLTCFGLTLLTPIMSGLAGETNIKKFGVC